MQRTRSRSRVGATVAWPCIARACAALLLSGIVSTVSPISPAFAETPAAAGVPISDPHTASIAEASERFGIPEHWIRAVMSVESAGDPRAVSQAGAMGLMQVMPGTWATLRQDYGLGSDPFEPRDNILGGTAYLRAMLDRFGSVGGMLAAYNAGPGRYEEFLSNDRPLPVETRAYVATLAPLLDGAAPIQSRAPADDWREAALFTDRSAASAQPSLRVPAAGRPPLEELAPAPSPNIFVVRPGEETQP